MSFAISLRSLCTPSSYPFTVPILMDFPIGSAFGKEWIRVESQNFVARDTRTPRQANLSSFFFGIKESKLMWMLNRLGTAHYTATYHF